MSWKETYDLWRSSPALSAGEQAELAALAGDEKELESRFCAQLAFGTAGLLSPCFTISMVQNATAAKKAAYGNSVQYPTCSKNAPESTGVSTCAAIEKV